MREQNDTCGALIESGAAQLLTIHPEQISAAQQDHIREQQESAKSRFETVSSQQEELKANLAEAQDIWTNYDENYRKLDQFIEKCDYFEETEKLELDPIRWKTDTAAIKNLISEIESLSELQSKMEEDVAKLKSICNCESDRMSTQAATMGVMLQGVPPTLNERLDQLTEVSELNENFKDLSHSTVSELLKLSGEIKLTKISWDSNNAITTDLHKKSFEGIQDEMIQLKQLYSQFSEMIVPSDIIDLEDRLREVRSGWFRSL